MSKRHWLTIVAALIALMILFGAFGAQAQTEQELVWQETCTGRIVIEDGVVSCYEVVEATATPSPTATPEPEDTPTSTPTPEPESQWHSPSDHEHGDEPPAWVLGSEMQPDFDAGEKHEGYKAMRVTEDIARGWVGNQKEIYFIFHAFSFPPALRVQHHSYQLWVLHSDDSVTWMQGAVDAGEYPDHRVNACTDDLNKPHIRTPYLGDCLVNEAWYPAGRGVHPDIVRSVGPGYYFDATDDLNDPTTWDETGLLGTNRLDTVIFRPEKDVGISGNFCADVQSGAIVECDTASALPQYVSPAAYGDCQENYNDCEIRGETFKDFSADGIELPN